MREDTKLARIRQAMREDRWDDALKLASRFQRLGDRGEIIRRAANAIGSPETYQALGYDLAKVREEGIAALKERYSKSWEEAREDGPETGRANTAGDRSGRP